MDEGNVSIQIPILNCLPETQSLSADPWTVTKNGWSTSRKNDENDKERKKKNRKKAKPGRWNLRLNVNVYVFRVQKACPPSGPSLPASSSSASLTPAHRGSPLIKDSLLRTKVGRSIFFTGVIKVKGCIKGPLIPTEWYTLCTFFFPSLPYALPSLIHRKPHRGLGAPLPNKWQHMVACTSFSNLESQGHPCFSVCVYTYRMFY